MNLFQMPVLRQEPDIHHGPFLDPAETRQETGVSKQRHRVLQRICFSTRTSHPYAVRRRGGKNARGARENGDIGKETGGSAQSGRPLDDSIEASLEEMKGSPKLWMMYAIKFLPVPFHEGYNRRDNSPARDHSFGRNAALQTP